MQQLNADEELCETPIPFYVQAALNRICKGGDCDFCCFSSEEDDWASDAKEGRICPDNLWWYVMQRQKVKQKFDASHPPFCPYCGKRMVADRTITYGDDDVAAFSCNHCHKIDRSARGSIEWERCMISRGIIKPDGSYSTNSGNPT